ncbi:hypothetical protein [Nocardioides panaciterrulae]|uniref:Uncharacterized protein n=1 Tax=Nocardioides panaciterrulae TaxID=661492 RepID=A0A7Y9E3H4_9ACTN|nr:hypothetical protein [Nocardioides panaciterrulae]NYD40548.1 hypothetical protein [Nocardioides panaciterrulae]
MNRLVHYEVVVRGGVGPAVRLALEPTVAGATRIQTVICARLGQDRDLVDLVRVLREHGFSVAGVTALA